MSMLSKTIRLSLVTTGALCLAASALAQPTTTKEKVAGNATVTTKQLKGEVVQVKGDSLVAKMMPGGEHRLFAIPPGKMATIDGHQMALNKVKPGTVLTADVTITETPVIDRTVTTLNGTVWHSSPNTVILTLENGENRQYDVPEGTKFTVNGQERSAMELRPGMTVTATKIVEQPRVEISQTAAVTGKSPTS
jgi:hypothetical protein